MLSSTRYIHPPYSEQVVDKALIRQLGEAHLLEVAYPAHVNLDIDQRRLVYYMGGWLLSIAISHVDRQRFLARAFLPFINSHKVGSAADFREAYPHFSGLEFVAEEGNIPWEAKGIIFPSAEFYLFVRALEVGYRSAMVNPALVATYLGDLPSDVRSVMSTAGPVKAAWARCVGLVKDPRLGPAGGKGCTKQCDELFDFVVHKWDKYRMLAETSELAGLEKLLKDRKEEKARRDKLKAGVGGPGSTTKQAKTPRPAKVYTAEQRQRQSELNQISRDAWRRLTVDQLKELALECGATLHPNFSTHKILLQRMLRSFAPRAGMHDDDTSPG